MLGRGWLATLIVQTDQINPSCLMLHAGRVQAACSPGGYDAWRPYTVNQGGPPSDVAAFRGSQQARSHPVHWLTP